MRERPSEIPESRELHSDEIALVRWLLDHPVRDPVRDASTYLPQVDRIRICSRCGCGCASLNFAIGERGWPEKGAMNVLSDHEWADPNGYRFGIFLFDHFGILAGIDVYAVDAPTVPDRLPTIVELER